MLIEIGPEAGLAIAEALASPHCELTKLVAGNNAFGPDAGTAFARVLTHFVTIWAHLGPFLAAHVWSNVG